MIVVQPIKCRSIGEAPWHQDESCFKTRKWVRLGSMACLVSLAALLSRRQEGNPGSLTKPVQRYIPAHNRLDC